MILLDLARMGVSLGLWALAVALAWLGWIDQNWWWFFLYAPAAAVAAWILWPSGHLKSRKNPWSY